MRRSSALRRSKRLERNGQYREAIDLLTGAASASPDPAIFERLVQLRHLAFSAIPKGPARPDWPPAYDDCFAAGASPPEISVEQLDASALGGGILHHGCLLVRDLIDATAVAELSDAIDKAFAAADGAPDASPGWYSPFEADERYTLPMRRHWVRQAAGVWAADSPPALHRLIRTLEEIGLDEVLTTYFGERPAFALNKVTLRDATPDAKPAWHQDGAFMGSALRSVNVWIALTACGGDALVPGLDILPRRLDDLVETGTRRCPPPELRRPGATR